MARVGPFLDPVTGSPNPDPDFAARLLSEQYESVFTQPREKYSVERPEEFVISECDPEWRQQHEGRHDMACEQLKTSSSPGPDGVPAELLKIACKELRRPLFLLWSASLDLLLVLISPVHKGR